MTSGIIVPSQRLETVRARVLDVCGIRNWRHLEYLAAGDAKCGEAFWIAEHLKIQARLHYIATAPPSADRRPEDTLRRSDEFWESYEDINRRWIPDDPVFSGARGGVTLATTTDLWTLTVGASGQLRVLESYIGGESTASTVLRLALQASTGGATPTNQTPEKFSSRSPAAVSTFATGWTTQPTLSGNPYAFHTFNTFGGTDRIVFAPGAEYFLVNGEKMSARSQSGIPVVSAHVIFEEL